MGVQRTATARPDINSLTNCQVRRTRVRVRAVRRDTTGHDMNLSLTTCQPNRIRVGGMMVIRRDIAGPGHGITHSLPSQQSQSGSEGSDSK